MLVSLQWCNTCKEETARVNHLFLHCSVVFALCEKVFKECNLSWYIWMERKKGVSSLAERGRGVGVLCYNSCVLGHLDGEQHKNF